MTQQYIGRKIVTAWPTTRSGGMAGGAEYHQSGYGVKYADGYTSFSPGHAFEEAYLAIGHIEHLPPWHQRLIGERALLDADVQALDRFMDSEGFAQLAPDHGTLLQMQLEAMFRYRDLLDQRLELLGTPAARRTLNAPAVATGD